MPCVKKFWLSRRKNCERKKYNPSELVVSIPWPIYCGLDVSDSKCLFERIARLKILPTGWSLGNFDDCDQLIVISRLFSYGRFILTIDFDCFWTIAINETCIHLPNRSLLNFCGDKITSVAIFQQLLQNIEKSQLCIGNPDIKFYQIRDARKGKFADPYGKLFIMPCIIKKYIIIFFSRKQNYSLS